MSDFHAKYVKCPYYLEQNNSSNNREIRCEGLTQKCIRSTHLFRTRAERDEHIMRYCYSIKKCKECPFHGTLDGKWGVADGV